MNLDEFFAVHDYATTTEANYRRVLSGLIAARPDLKRVSAVDLKSWIRAHHWGNSQECLALCAVKMYLRWRFGDRHPALQVKIARKKSRAGRTLNLDQVRVLLGSFCTLELEGIRNLAISALFLDTGLRCSEMCRLDLCNLDLDQRNLQVIIKGGQWEMGVFSEWTGQYLANWLAVRPATSVSMVFVSLTEPSYGRQMTRGALGRIVARWGKACGFDLSPHDLRRTFATVSTRCGAPERIVMVAGRWHSVETFQRYVHAIEAEDFRLYFPVSKVME